MAKSSIPANETNEQKLARLANVRVNKLLAAVRQVAFLARFNPSVPQRDKVFNAVKAELEAAHKAWTEKKVSQGGFSL